MGAVYEAVDQRLSSIVAIKETLVTSDEARLAFEREASLLANLRHRSLPSVTDHFAEGDGQFLVMQFIPGEDLAQLLELRQRAFPAQDVLRWAEEILKALEYLHSHNPPILHRDIKPANLKLTREGELFLIDFGLSKGAAGQMPTLLTSRSVKGYTAAYAPLEQIHGGGTDPRSDLYSVGATLYHLLTYVPPVDAPTRFNALDDLQADPTLPADQVNSQVPHELAQVLSQTMAMNRRHRPASATAMQQMLRQVISVPAEAAVTLRKQPTPVLTPTEPSPRTQPLPPTRQTQPPEPSTPPAQSPPPVPTIKEVPNLIERPARVPTTPVLLATPEPARVPEATPSQRRRFATLVLISIGVLIVLGFASAIIVPWLMRRNAIQNRSIANPSPVVAQESAETKPIAPTKKYFAGDFDVGKALELVYGSYDNQKKYVKWKLTAEEIQKSPIASESSGLGPGTVYTAPNFAQAFTQGGVQRYVLVTETVPAHYDCHACAPIIGGAVFSRQGDNWQLDTETKIIATMGSWGSAPKGKLTKIGPDRYGVGFDNGYMGQGVTSEWINIVAEVGTDLREIANIGLNGDSGTCKDPSDQSLTPCWKYSSKMTFEPGSNPDYYDLKVSTTGTEQDDAGKVRSANRVKKYVFSDGKYVTSR